jgi:hypothetical protein
MSRRQAFLAQHVVNGSEQGLGSERFGNIGSGLDVVTGLVHFLLRTACYDEFDVWSDFAQGSDGRLAIHQRHGEIRNDNRIRVIDYDRPRLR